MELEPKQKRQRYILLRRKAALDQRIRNLKSDYPDRILVEARIQMKIAELIIEITPLGGVPKRWVETLC